MQKQDKKNFQEGAVLGWIVLVLGIGLMIAGGYFYKTGQLQKFLQLPSNVVCTQDAKRCPDGSYVGRVGVNCEFERCPGVK